ncbi:MAG: translation elongation factor 4 [Patescibacteria group bacterium]|nr:translation elongation factor 4 [Patescibacteria group bacterium]
MKIPLEAIRNFCVIAHIDHGKSTLADRFLELTGTVSKREMKNQLLDQMDLERERGITIKLQPVHMRYRAKDSREYFLNLIDTPGHVDFSYEVSRTLAAVEGAILLVDASQGIEAQTLSHLYLALEQDLEIIPVINKIDLPNADVAKVSADLVKLLGVEPNDIIPVSAKTGKNVDLILERVIKTIPAPRQAKSDSPCSLIFDSIYDEYRGVVAYIRLFAGEIKAGDKIRFLQTGREAEVLEVGIFKPTLEKRDFLNAGQIGYIVTSLKEVSQCHVGDTIVRAALPYPEPLPGYKKVKPMVFAGLYSKDGAEYSKLREAVEKLKLNDAAFVFEPENFPALGFGFRAGFLGLLHLEIVQERLQREYGIDLVVMAPTVAYRVKKRYLAEMISVRSPQELPEPAEIESIEEPWLKLDIVSPSAYIGPILKLIQSSHGEYKVMEYLDPERVVVHSQVPLASVILDFYDRLKSATRGYASMNYEFFDYRPADLIKLDILVAGEVVEPLTTIVRESEAYAQGRLAVENLKKVLPKQLFEVKIQAAISGKIIAASRLAPLRKDVTAKLYGGDVTRKRKLLDKQKKGKKRMKETGRVDIPPGAFLSLLRRK